MTANLIPKRVLVVDDTPMFLEMMARTLGTQGHETGTAANGVEGLRKFREHDWDLVITDLQMPTMGGDEMASVIRAEAPEVPVILMTGSVGFTADGSDFYAIIAKPFRGGEIIALVGQALAAAKT